jgi:O-antigen/teichoic acid export membrane protein
MKVNFNQIVFEPLLRLGFSHKIQATALWSLLESFSSPFFSILLLPIFTHNLGMENYGLYVMVMALVSFFGFTGLGMNTSITYYLAVNYQTSNSKQIAQRLTSALLITLIGTVLFSCLFLLVLSIFETQFKEHYSQLSDKQQLIYIALGLVIITQLDGVVSSAIKGLQQFKISSKIEFVLRLLSFMVVALVAAIQKSVEAIALVVLVMAILNLLVRLAMLNKIVNFDLREIKINKQITNELFHFGKWMTFQGVSGALFGSLDKLVIGSFLGNAVLGSYNVLISIAQLIHFIPASSLTFIMPKIAVNNRSISKATLRKVSIVTAILSIIFSIVIFACKGIIFSHFHLDGNYENLFCWLIFNYFLLSLSVPVYFIAIGMHLIKAVSLQSIMGSLVGVIFLVIFISEYGLVAALVSKLIYSFLAFFIIIPVLRKVK